MERIRTRQRRICDEVAEIWETSSARRWPTSSSSMVARTAMITPGWWPAGRRGYGIDIPPGVYESGGGYNWRKKTGVVIQQGSRRRVSSSVQDDGYEKPR